MGYFAQKRKMASPFLQEVVNAEGIAAPARAAMTRTRLMARPVAL
jgi:hypothetical protein